MANEDFNGFPFYGRRVSVGTLPGSYGPVVVTGGKYAGCCGIYEDDEYDEGRDSNRAMVYLEGEGDYVLLPYYKIRRIGYFDCERKRG